MPQLPYIPVSIFTQTDGFLGFILPTRAFAGLEFAKGEAQTF